MKRSQAGFSMIELLFAVLILGIGIAGMARGITASLSASKESEIQTKAALFAAGRMEFLRADGYYIAGSDEGECGAVLPGYVWEQTLTESAEHEGLFDVVIKILPHIESDLSVFTLETRLYEPPLGITSTSDRENARRNDRRSESP